MQHPHAHQTRLIEVGVTNTIHKNLLSTMSNFQETSDNIEYVFHVNLEDASLLVSVLKNLGNLIENTNGELNRGLLNDLKKNV